jgi:putative MATE family efflux protein
VQSLWLAGLIGMVLLAVGQVAAVPLIEAFGGEGAVATNAEIYLRIGLFGVPAVLVVFAGTGYLRGLQDTVTPLVISLATAAGNFVLEVALIWGLGFGIGASALSTVLAQIVAATIYVVRVARAVAHHDVELAPRARALRDLLVVGRDLLIRTAALRIAFVVATAVAARIGTEALAAHEIAFAVFATLALALDAIAIAAQAMVGRMLGAGEPEVAREASWRMIHWGIAAGLLLGGLTLAARPVLADLFTSDVSVAALATYLFVWVALLQPLSGVVFTLDGVLIGASDMGYLAVAMVISTAVFLPAALAVVVLDLGIGWLWAALALFMAARAVTLGIRFAGDRWLIVGAPAS